jgi:hypothetical protein
LHGKVIQLEQAEPETSLNSTLSTNLSPEEINKIIDGLVGNGGLFELIQNQITNQVTNQRIPIVGTGLKAATQFFDGNFITKVKNQLEAVKNSPMPTVAALQKSLFDALGVNLDPNTDDGGNDGIPDTIADLQDIKLLTENNKFEFDLKLKQNLVNSSVSIPLDIGLPALKFESTANLGLDAQVGLDCGDSHGSDPILATKLDNGVLQLNMGRYASQRAITKIPKQELPSVC